MVNSVATVGRSGVHDFILIRTSAVILALYSLFMASFFITTPEVTFDVWRSLFASMPVKIFTFLALLSLLIHVWIGLWQVLSDYVKSPFLRGVLHMSEEVEPAFLRGVLQFLFTVVLFVYFTAGFLIMWGV